MDLNLQYDQQLPFNFYFESLLHDLRLHEIVYASCLNFFVTKFIQGLHEIVYGFGKNFFLG